MADARPSPDAAAREAARVRAQLRTLVEAWDVSLASIERRAGLSRGYLAQLFAGRIELQMRHVLMVLMALDVPPSAFFGRIYGAADRLPRDSALADAAAAGGMRALTMARRVARLQARLVRLLRQMEGRSA
ncbi:MAG: hypothetical protein AAF772_05180 [Acidobacteriota bacterium]